MPISLKNTGSIQPYIRYSPQANTMTVADEDNKPRKIEFFGKSFAIDIENGSMGWLLIGEGIRDWKPFPINNVTPPSPGPNYKRGFLILLYAPKLLGSPEAHEMCASTGAHLSFCERLYNEAEASFGQGNVPIVKITEAEPIKVGKGKSRELKFEIVKWVPRPAAIAEALTKLREAAESTTNKKSTGTNGATQTDTGGNDFDDDVKPEAEPKKTTEKPKARAKKAQAEEPHSSDLLDDEIPFA
jgi:hypothetical protein